MENSVSTKPVGGIVGLNQSPATEQHTWLDLTDPDGSVVKLLHERYAERPNGGLGSAVDTSPGVGLATSDRTKVDNVAGVPLLKVCIST